MPTSATRDNAAGIPSTAASSPPAPSPALSPPGAPYAAAPSHAASSHGASSHAASTPASAQYLSASSPLTRIPPLRGNGGPPASYVRPTLPDRNVTGETLEDAYVRFILYCNPAVPLDVDVTALADAFRNPPKSGGKSFSTFTLFQLVKQLEEGEIRTWAELALRLGVEPPDQDKGESTQKIQQYAVRLKRWMHSMHVDAFFEYLLSRSHPYWTQIPTSASPICEDGRDGVAAEDDMALRALLPHLRPRRGRKRPDEDDSNKSQPQRPRIEVPASHDEYQGSKFDKNEVSTPWSAHPEGRLPPILPPIEAISSATGTLPAADWAHHRDDAAPTPMTAYPHSAITPSTQTGFWGDMAEPKSAITPSKSKSSHRRHGPKVVSSAWQVGPASKVNVRRGRPPKHLSEGQPTIFISQPPPFQQNTPDLGEKPALRPPENTIPTPPQPPATQPPGQQASASLPTPPPGSVVRPPDPMLARTAIPPLPPPPPVPTQNARPAKPSISLQVPERVGGSVRLATPPPPVVMVNGHTHDASEASRRAPEKHTPAVDIPSLDCGSDLAKATHAPLSEQGGPIASAMPTNLFDDMNDRTNIDRLYSHFILETMNGDWVDVEGNPSDPCSVEEAHALVTAVMENLYKARSSVEGFLINLAALAGGKMLMTTSRLRITRSEVTDQHTRYSCNWEYRLGPIRGYYSMTQDVSSDKWRPPAKTGQGAEQTRSGDNHDSSQYWQKKYEDLMGVVSQKDQQLHELECKLHDSHKGAQSSQS